MKLQLQLIIQHGVLWYEWTAPGDFYPCYATVGASVNGSVKPRHM